MKILVVGNGGREHAIAWCLLQSPQVEKVFCAPGNGGTALLERCQNVALSVTDFDGIARWVKEQGLDLVVVGPEVPLAEGITDQLRSQGIQVFGPTQAGAQIEASKAWAKQLMAEAGIPTAASALFTEPEAAIAYVQDRGAPIVIKADGLAAGKGVTVAMTLAEALGAIQDAFSGKFGAAGQQLVIEEYLIGEEVSVLAVTDGLTIRPLLSAQDHKRIGEGDTGANTGGMGAYAPVPWMTEALQARIQTEILEPAIEILQRRQIDYRGVLYAGLMVTSQGDPKVIEFNCRFGDPETQVVLPLLATPLEEIFLACVHQTLADLPPIAWKPGTSACVVVASAGYPDTYPKGQALQGLETAAAETGAVIFHAGTRLQDGVPVVDGGRVLGVSATGETFDRAFATAYQAIDRIQSENLYYRRDIGHRVR